MNCPTMRFLFLVLLIAVNACSKPQIDASNAAQTPNDMPETTLEKLRAEGYSCTPSQGEGRYTLCLLKKSPFPGAAQSHIHYSVFDNQTQRLLLQDSVFNGEVKWHGPTQLSVFQAPGTMPMGASKKDYTTIIDIEK